MFCYFTGTLGHVVFFPNEHSTNQTKKKVHVDRKKRGWETATRPSNDITLQRAIRSRVGRASVGRAQTKQAIKSQADVPAFKLVRLTISENNTDPCYPRESR